MTNVMRRALWGAVAVTVCGCNPTWKEITTANQAVTDEAKTKFRKLRSETWTAVPLDSKCTPPAKLHQKLDAEHDTDVIDVDALDAMGDPDRHSDLQFHTPFESPLNRIVGHVHESGAKYRPPNERVTKLVVDQYKHAAQTKYVVVVNTRGADRDKGTGTLEAFLFDWSGPKLLCAIAMPIAVGENLGTTDYKVVRHNRKTGEEKTVRTDSHDNFTNALYTAGTGAFDQRLRAELGVSVERDVKL